MTTRVIFFIANYFYLDSTNGRLPYISFRLNLMNRIAFLEKRDDGRALGGRYGVYDDKINRTMMKMTKPLTSTAFVAALMLSTSLDLLAVCSRSQRLEDEVDRIAGLGRPARWLEDIRLDLLVES